MKPNIIPHRHYKEQSKNKIYKKKSIATKQSQTHTAFNNEMRLLRRQRVIVMHMKNYRRLDNHLSFSRLLRHMNIYQTEKIHHVSRNDGKWASSLKTEFSS